MERVLMILVIFAGMIPLAFGDVFIQNDRQYVGDDDSLHIVGEIQNDSEVPLGQISVFVTLFDGNSQIIATKETGSLVNTIMPGMKGPFDLVLTSFEARDVRSYSLELDYRASSPKNQAIEITESELSRDNYNNLMITGTVTNRGDITANTVAVIATLYDKDGIVAAVSRIHPEPDYLRSEDNAFFLIAIPDKMQTGLVEDFALVAESEEYATVPEFPVGSVVLLVGTLSVYVGVTRFSGRIISNVISAASPK